VLVGVDQKLELIEKLQFGLLVAIVFMEYGVKKQMVSDIRKTKSVIKKHYFLLI
jgi:hypothetical protein